MSETKLSNAWQCQSCGCYFPHIPKILDNDVKRCSKCVQVEILEARFSKLDPDHKWMRREIERVGRALFTSANGYVGTEDDLKAVGQVVEGICETMEKGQADNLRFIKANAEVANLNADLQDENMLLREALYKIANDHNRPSIDGDPFFYSEYAEMTAEAALASDDLSKLTTQQKPTEEAMLHANPSCGMDGCLWQEDSNSA